MPVGNVGGGIPVVLYPTLRSDGNYGLTVGDEAAGSLLGSKLVFCGYGAVEVGEVGKCRPPGSGSKPFLVNPTVCSATAPETTFSASLWLEPETPPITATRELGPFVKCGELKFVTPANTEPTLEFKPSESKGEEADKPTGIKLALTVPQTNSPIKEDPITKKLTEPERATPTIKELKTLLPVGLTVSRRPPMA